MEENMTESQQKQQPEIEINNNKANKQKVAHHYMAGNQVLSLRRLLNNPKLKLHEGPNRVLSFNKLNSIIHIQGQNYIKLMRLCHVSLLQVRLLQVSLLQVHLF